MHSSGLTPICLSVCRHDEPFRCVLSRAVGGWVTMDGWMTLRPSLDRRQHAFTLPSCHIALYIRPSWPVRVGQAHGWPAVSTQHRSAPRVGAGRSVVSVCLSVCPRFFVYRPRMRPSVRLTTDQQASLDALHQRQAVCVHSGM